LLDYILGDHAANLGRFVKEGQVTLIVQVEIHCVALWLALESEGARGPDGALAVGWACSRQVSLELLG